MDRCSDLVGRLVEEGGRDWCRSAFVASRNNCDDMTRRAVRNLDAKVGWPELLEFTRYVIAEVLPDRDGDIAAVLTSAHIRLLTLNTRFRNYGVKQLRRKICHACLADFRSA